MFNKKGVALVTVLLLMLVATIAATATYKWLSSEQRSSASRMNLVEAQQASKAGLDAVRAWMTYHANDVGAVIRQYIDGHNKPVKLDTVVKQFGSSKQDYSVWLTGVDATKSPYRLKITSVGTARGGFATYNENTILKVSGLYQATIPGSVAINFDGAFAGGHPGITGSDSLQSGMISGDFGNNNTPVLYSKMIITGKAIYGGDITHEGDVYIGKGIEAKGSITFGKPGAPDTLVAYVGGPVKCADAQPFTVYGDLYLVGPIEKCILDVKGNLTVAGNLNVAFDNNNYKISVGKNMVFTDTSTCVMDFSKNGANFNQYTTITVGGNLYLPDKIEAHCNADQCGDQAGSKNITVTGKVYRYNKTGYYNILRQNVSGTAYGIYMNTTDQASIYSSENYNKNHRISSISASSFESQEIGEWSRQDYILKDVDGEYWTKIDKIKGYGNLIVDDAIPQPLLVDNEAEWKAKTANSYCGGILNASNGKFNMDNNAVDALNNCYERASAAGDKLYNGFLVIKWNYNQNQQPTKTLNHKFVLYATDKLGGDPYLPATSKDGMVFLHLEEGAGQLNAVGEHNYVIYSKEDIDQINGLQLTGTLILEPGKQLLKTQGGTRLRFGKDVVSKMAIAGLIKENPDYTKLANPDAEPTSGSAGGVEKLDDYYVSTAPELSISLESQYKNKEIDPTTLNDNNSMAIQPSVIVMPRVIYITQDLVGRLSDYYNVLNLNKATDDGKGSVTCDPSDLSSTTKYDGKTLVPEDIYTCTYESSFGDNPFYVVVGGKNGLTPMVRLKSKDSEQNWAQIDAEEAAYVYMGVEVDPESQNNAATMSVGINVYNLPDSWSLTHDASVQEVSSGVDGVRSFIVSFSAFETNKYLFKVTSSHEDANVHFELSSPLNGCMVGTQGTYDVSLFGTATIQRADVPKDYCAGHSTIMASNNMPYNCDSIVTYWPNCGPSQQKGVWVYPYCNSLKTNEENEQWECGTNYAIRLLKNNISPYCLAFIPDTSLEAEKGKTYTLYASLKRRPYKLYVKAVGTVGNVIPEISVNDSTLTPISTEGDYQVYQVFAGYSVKAVASSDASNRHKFWSCSGPDCGKTKTYPHSVATYLINGVDTLIAHYNVRDGHCFFDSFNDQKNSKGVNEPFKMWCPNNTYENCLDRCKSKTHCSVGVEGKTYEGYDPEANWMLIYTNSGARRTNECLKRVIICIKYAHEYRSFTTPSTLGGTVGEFFFDDGLLRAPGAFDLDILNIFDNYAPTFMLNRAKAGTNGKMSLKMKLPFDGTSIAQNINIFEDGDDLNDGAVVRSDSAGNSYLAVTLYKGFALADGHYGAMVRVCYVEGQDNDGSDCMSTNLVNKYDGSYVPLKSLSDVSLNITLDGASLTVDVDYNTAIFGRGSHDLGFASFDLSKLKNTSLSYGTPGHEYVGIKMFNPFYRYKDISWSSETYSDSCFNTPRIYCSFANKYLGGTVPKDSNVTPWVGMSSWFDGNSDCDPVEYYYNGCDMDANLFHHNFISYLSTLLKCAQGPNSGFWSNGVQLSGSTYNFKDQGYHKIDTSKTLIGSLKLSGYAKNASVQVTCGSTTYSSDCGQFYVGDIVSCTKHELSFEQDKYCSSDPCSVEMPDGEYANLRDAKVSMTISNLNGAIKVYLIDQNNMASVPYAINMDGLHEFNVSQVLENIGFDPQMVKAVRFEGASGYTVSGLQGYCSNAPGISNCTASFDGSGFAISTAITNTINAASGGCTVSNNEGYLNDVTRDCPANGTFYVPGSNVYEDLNNGTEDSKNYTFTVTLTDKDNNQSTCQTNSVTVQKTAMSCWVEDSEINAGEVLPAFKYYIKNCPAGGCNATVELEGKIDPLSVTYNKNCTDDIYCESQSWTPTNINTAAGTLTYKLKHSTLSPCEAMVTVNEVTPASVTSCSLSDGTFTANIVPATDGSSWSATLAVSDAQGNVISESQRNHTGTGTSWSVALPTMTQQSSDVTYVVNMTLNGQPVGISGCSPYWTVTGSGSSGAESSNDGNTSSANQNTVSCSITSTTESAVVGSNSATMSIPANSVTVNGCGAGECKYTVKDGSSTVGGPETYSSEYSLYFNGATEAGTHNYTVSIKRGNEDAVNCTGTHTVNYTGSSNNLNCAFSQTTIDFGESVTFTANYGGNCHSGIFKQGSTVLAYNCISNISVTPENTGTLTYTYSVTEQVNGNSETVSCSADITVNDVEVTGSETISSRNVATDVDCKKTIIVSTTTDPYNETWLHCTGSFNKTVGSTSADQYQEAKVWVCDPHGHNNAEQSCTGTFTTNCLPGRTLSCTVGGQ